LRVTLWSSNIIIDHIVSVIRTLACSKICKSLELSICICFRIFSSLIGLAVVFIICFLLTNIAITWWTSIMWWAVICICIDSYWTLPNIFLLNCIMRLLILEKLTWWCFWFIWAAWIVWRFLLNRLIIGISDFTVTRQWITNCIHISIHLLFFTYGPWRPLLTIDFVLFVVLNMIDPVLALLGWILSLCIAWSTSGLVLFRFPQVAFGLMSALLIRTHFNLLWWLR